MSTVLRRAPLLLLAGTLALVMTACGSEQAGGSGGAQPPRTKVTHSPTTRPPQGGVVLHRSGGIAGFMDSLTVKADGRAVLTSHGRQEYTCTVKPSVLDSIRSQAAQVRSEGPAKRGEPKPTKSIKRPMPDRMYLTLEVGDTTMQYADLTQQDEGARQLFTSMHDVLAAAIAARDGKSGSDSALCS